MTDTTLRRTLQELATVQQRQLPTFNPLPHQKPPKGDWWLWLLEAGRGAGKTAAAAHFMQTHLNGPRCVPPPAAPHRCLLVAPTIGDGIESAYLNDQALTRIEPGARFTASVGGARVTWPNKSQIKVLGTHTREDINRLRAAGNNCFMWAEEWASWRYITEAWEIMLPGIRVGPNPQIVATTTPKPRPEYVALRAHADRITAASMLDNPHLNPTMVDRIVDMYGDTTIGRQEIFGRLIEEAEGALWTTEMIQDDRMDTIPVLGRTVVGVDPPGGVTEAGIVTAAVIPNCPCEAPRTPHFAVLDDTSGKMSPDKWGAAAVGSYDEWDADRILGEANYGGDMVEAVIRNIDPNVSYKPVHASRGKKIRAEPIMALYEQHRVHHIGTHAELEAEMVLWEPDVSDWSPNRLDALVWALTDLAKTKIRRRMRSGAMSDPDLMKR